MEWFVELMLAYCILKEGIKNTSRYSDWVDSLAQPRHVAEVYHSG